MRLLQLPLLILLTVLLLAVESFVKDEACLKEKEKFGKIQNGAKCQELNLRCKSTKAACTGGFDEATMRCVDAYLECQCNKAGANGTNRTWTCVQNFMCLKPDDRCTCHDASRVGPGKVCYKRGLECPDRKRNATCVDLWNATKKTCYNATRYSLCTCKDKKWNCSRPSCPKKDRRCL
jgi:hypothetical protein